MNSPSDERLAVIRRRLLAAFEGEALWGTGDPARQLPPGVARGSDRHLAFLTLTCTLSGGRDPRQLWPAARQVFRDHPQLFDPLILAHTDPRDLLPQLNAHGLLRKPKSEAVLWQRIGKAIVMRGGGAVAPILASEGHDARNLLRMLQKNKATFPVLSGPQTAPRWLYCLARAGQQPIEAAARSPVPVSPYAARALESLSIKGKRLSAEMFEPLDALGRRGCVRRKPKTARCPVAEQCPVAAFCRFGKPASPTTPR